MGDNTRRRLRVVCAGWSVLWFTAWLGMTAVVLAGVKQTYSTAWVWFRTGALMAAWAGYFAWKALEPPAKGK